MYVQLVQARAADKVFNSTQSTDKSPCCQNRKLAMVTSTVGTISLGRISDICSFRQCGMAQLHTSVAVRLIIASQPARPPVYGLGGAESACSACEVSLKAAGP